MPWWRCWSVAHRAKGRTTTNEKGKEMTDLEHCYTVVDGLKLHYVVSDAGEPVLLTHGFPQTWYEWREFMAELAKTYTVIAPDYRGAGESERPQGGYDKHTMMEDLRGLVQLPPARRGSRYRGDGGLPLRRRGLRGHRADLRGACRKARHEGRRPHRIKQTEG